MNVVTPLPIAYGYPTNNVGTDAARRENVQREVIPATSQNEKAAAEKGLANEQDKASSAFTNPTYDKPSANQQEQIQAYQEQNNSVDEQLGDQESAGKQDAKDEQEQQAEQKKIADLKARDTEVRLHEQAHAAVGGQYAGAPSYEYEKGPDGKRYAVGGEVSIDVSEAKDPEDTVRKMQQVKAAALAPAEPSAQDYKVAAEATQKEQTARAQMAKESVESLQEKSKSDTSKSEKADELGAVKSGEASDKYEKQQRVVAGFYANIAQNGQSNVSVRA